MNFKKNFPLKLGDWSKSDLGIVVENLKLLQQSLRLTDEETREIFSSLKSDEDRAKKNSVGYWCCQGISSSRDPSEVFQKVRLHLLRDTQKIQSDPDQVETTRILEIGDFLELFRNNNVSGGSQRTPLHIAGWSKDEYIFFFFIKIILIPAEFILSRDISVPAVVLQAQQNFFPASLRVVLRRDLASSLPASIRVGRWSPQDQTRIIENLQDLQARVLHSVSRINSEEFLTPAVLCHQQPSRASKAPTIGFGTKYRGISCP